MNKLILLLIFGMVFVSGCDVYDTLYPPLEETKESNSVIITEKWIFEGFEVECVENKTITETEYEEFVDSQCFEERFLLKCLTENLLCKMDIAPMKSLLNTTSNPNEIVVSKFIKSIDERCQSDLEYCKNSIDYELKINGGLNYVKSMRYKEDKFVFSDCLWHTKEYNNTVCIKEILVRNLE